MTVPYPDPVVIQLLIGLPGLDDIADRISTRLDKKLPAIRVTKVTDREAPSTWEGTPVFQVEVWAPDEYQAGQLAWAIKNAWPSATKQTVGNALVTGRWIAVDPYSSPDPESNTPRQIVSVGIRLSGAST